MTFFAIFKVKEITKKCKKVKGNVKNSKLFKKIDKTKRKNRQMKKKHSEEFSKKKNSKNWIYIFYFKIASFLSTWWNTHLFNGDCITLVNFSPEKLEFQNFENLKSLGDYAGFPGCGLLRLHSTYRHDLKIYASGQSCKIAYLENSEKISWKSQNWNL